MSARLPQPGGDDGQWGDILNEFLQVAHNSDGSLKAIDQSQVAGLAAVLADTITGSDVRLSDERTPSDGSVTDAKVAAGAAISADKLADGANNVVMTAAERALLAGATSTSGINTLVKRSDIGWVQLSGISGLGSPGNSGDATSKAYVDAQTTVAENRANHTGTQSADTITDGTTNKVLTAADKVLLASATILDTGSSLVMRNGSGQTNFQRVYATAGPPTLASELTRKDYVDTYGSASPADAAAATGTVDLSMVAFAPPKVRVLTLSGNVTVSNAPSSLGATRAGVTVLTFKQAATGGPYTVAWPAVTSLPWAGGAAAPSMPTAANAELEVHLFWTGQSWRAKVGGTYFP